MPKIKRSHKPPPEGWDLIEPTLKELEQKLRDGKPLWVLFSRSFHFHLSTSSLSLSFCLLFQLRTSLMRGNVELKPYGPLWSFIISVLGTFMTCITRGRPLARNCMIIASRKATRIQTSLQSGRRSGKTSQGLHWFELIFQFEFEFEFELNWIFVLLCEKSLASTTCAAWGARRPETRTLARLVCAVCQRARSMGAKSLSVFTAAAVAVRANLTTLKELSLSCTFSSEMKMEHTIWTPQASRASTASRFQEDVHKKCSLVSNHS